ncbi:hypothetical protein [Paenibacillus graminis]|uniref:hypothetical protein n=1 Tax=Paenibacillus graminis TaxID=189425 RepID=UPI002DBCE067|nr:hypothetical protein [Paenibacillus graminis]MEC0167841.1 hypothetical protein [Paenibacillus graminis]
MRHLLKLVVSSMLLAIVLTSCISSKDKEFNDLAAQAKAHEDNFDYQAAADVYTKALDIKEDPEVRTKLNNLNNEIEEIRGVKGIINEIKTISGAYKNVLSSEDLLSLCEKLTKLVSQLEALDTSSGGSAANYIDKLKASTYYFSFTSSIESAQIYQTVGGAGHDAFTDAKAIDDEVTALLSDVSFPPSFASIN